MTMHLYTERLDVKAARSLHPRYDTVRKSSVTLARPLSEEDCCAQSMPDASPIKWHLAHTTWFFETFILERYEPDFQPHHPAFRMLFNSYYNGVGEKHVRAQRGLLTRPSLDEVLAYRHNVDMRMGALLERLAHGDQGAELASLIELGLQHEQQHQELMLTDVKHLLATNPLQPAYTENNSEAASQAAPMVWQTFEAGVVEIGHDGDGFCFDNETPHHHQFVERFSIASRLVTNGEFLAFVDAGGYQIPALWLSEGWDWVNANQLTHPLYWHPPEASARSGWQEYTLHGLQPLDLQRPASHLSLFEADAYARWAGARLPTEWEWERAAAGDDSASRSLHPQARWAGSADESSQWFGACWQWTTSSYAPYPGYAPADGALGEYNGKFMVNQYVLRGSSCVTPQGHSRITYRNFFPATARWQFSGIRLARS
jgi:ergothioneine biosynthesis protein EgtB